MSSAYPEFITGALVFLGGFVAKVVTDWLADWRTGKREEAARHAAKAERRDEFQRSALMEMQQLLADYGRTIGKMNFSRYRCAARRSVLGQESVSRRAVRRASGASQPDRDDAGSNRRCGDPQFNRGDSSYITRVLFRDSEAEANDPAASRHGERTTTHERIGAAIRRLLDGE